MKMLRIHRVSNDASKDYYLPKKEVELLYSAGQLSKDLTNGGYCEHSGGHSEPIPPRYPYQAGRPGPEEK